MWHYLLYVGFSSFLNDESNLYELFYRLYDLIYLIHLINNGEAYTAYIEVRHEICHYKKHIVDKCVATSFFTTAYLVAPM